MIKRAVRGIREVLAGPFRRSVAVNRNVMVGLLRPFRGRFLELGPGKAPILAKLDWVADEHKTVLEFPGVIAHCAELGYTCVAQDIGRDAWDLGDSSMDVVLSNQVLEHIPHTDHVIHESRRVLKPGGKLLISVPNPGALAYIAMLLLTVNPPMSMVSDEYYGLGNPFSSRRGKRSAEYGTQGHGHLRLFTPRAMNDLLRVNGFRVLRNHGASWGTPILGRFLARVFPWYGLMTIVLAEKQVDGPGNAGT